MDSWTRIWRRSATRPIEHVPASSAWGWLGYISRSFQSPIWIWPLFTALLLVGLAFWLRQAIEGVLKQQLATELQTILKVDVTALELWFHSHETNAKHLATELGLSTRLNPLLDLASTPDTPPRVLLEHPEWQTLSTTLKLSLESLGYQDYLIISTNELVVASSRDDLVGQTTPALFGECTWLGRTLAGSATVSPPFTCPLLALDDSVDEIASKPIMIVTAPIHDASHHLRAALLLSLDPSTDYVRILQIARQGKTGETFAFDASGRLLSESRFNDRLAAAGLIPNSATLRSMLHIELRNPQANLTRGERPRAHTAKQPLIRMVTAATSGLPDLTVEGYRDYRGVPVIGAWTWLPDYDIGVGTQMDLAEAYHPLYLIRRAVLGLLAILALGAGIIHLMMLAMNHAKARARQAAMDAQQIGPYALEAKIGAGGMGEVYRARHALLRRPIAIKLLRSREMTIEDTARFEREVQHTSQLNHPNTVAVYDFGRTPEGILYYVMEYLDGISLDLLVARFGPQPEGRVIHILAQICAALAEAHDYGLVHLDIKPANVMLNQRGCLYDLVKVLDFGLVQAISTPRKTKAQSSDTIIGTPAYLSPEAIDDADNVDARSDLYAVGAVGYFLLTGTPVFLGREPMEICSKQLKEIPQPPAQRLGRPVAADLENIIVWCLSKKQADRPATALVLRDALLHCSFASQWTPNDAKSWWQLHFPPASIPASNAAPQSMPVRQEILHSDPM